MRRLLMLAAFGAAILGATPGQAQQGPNTLLNVSYDIARELYAAVNVEFIKSWKQKTGQDITINQSHAGSSRQARSIIEGLEADVVTFNQVTDVQVLHDKGNFVAANWKTRLANNASPYYSLPAFLVRKGNPKNIKDWDDLVRPDVKVVFPNPKTSGNARYTYLAARAYAKAKYGSEEKADEFIVKLFKNVPVFDTGGRGATTTFLERDIGDVLVTFEAETNGIRDQFPDKAQTVVPSMSLLAEFPVAVVDKVVDKRGSRALATAYLDYLYSRDGQEILAKFYNRVHNPEIIAKYKDKFPDVKLVTVEDVYGGWDKATKDHLAPGAKLDQLFGSVKGL